MHKSTIRTFRFLFIISYVFFAQNTLAAEPTGNVTDWFDRVTLTGRAEVQLQYFDTDVDNDWQDQSVSDLKLQELELVLAFAIAESINLNTSFISEVGAEELTLDLGWVHLASPFDNSISLDIGKIEIPFSNGATYLVTEPLIRELAETFENGGLITLPLTPSWLVSDTGEIELSFYLYNGSIDKQERNTIENYGLSVEITEKNFTLGFDYTNNAMDSNLIEEILDYTPQRSVPSAWVIHGQFNLSQLEIMLESFSAEKFKSLSNIQPKSLHVETAFKVGQQNTLSLAHQASEDTVLFGLPEERTSVAVIRKLSENLIVSAEVHRDTDYPLAEGGTDEELLGVQLQLEIIY